MGGCRCSYKGCTSVTTPDKTLHFFHYPVKVPDICTHWIKNADKPHFRQLSEDQLRNKVVCEYHFEDRCFPNFQKKRLLKGAIPTLDGPALLKPVKSQSTLHRSPQLTLRPSPGTTARSISTSSRQQGRNADTPKIELLSANDDATLFVLDTSSIEFPVTPKVEVVESYIYENGSLLPSKEMEKTDGSMMELSMISDKHDTEDRCQDEPKTTDTPYKMDCNEQTYSVLYCENSSDGVEYPIANKSIPPSTQNSNVGSKHIGQPERRAPVPDRRCSTSEDISKKFMQKVKENSRDIASIKQFIRNNMCVRRAFHNKSSLLRGIKRFVSPSLYSVLKMNLGCRKILSSDLKFFISIYEKSPEVYKMLCREYKWNLPDIKDMKALITEQQK